MKHFLVEITYTASPARIAEVKPDHRTFLRTGYDRGLLLCSGPQNPPVGGIVVARAESLEDITKFFDRDPYRIQALATYRFVEFDPVLYQPQMENWIKS